MDWLKRVWCGVTDEEDKAKWPFPWAPGRLPEDLPEPKKEDLPTYIPTPKTHKDVWNKDE